MENNNQDRRDRKQWAELYRYFVLHPYTAILSFAMAGLIFWGGFNWCMTLTNSESFCISCHEMRENVYKEYKDTIHYSNRTGVRATCPDCHVPKEWVHMVRRKIGATNELFHKIIGSINTPEKFRAKRLQLSEYVWQNMEETDSRECRNCHNFNYMTLASQKKSSQRAHKRATENNLTCINCHMGIAHHIAEEFDKDGKLHEKFKQEKRPCADCHKGMAQADDW
ncbi:MAG: NapC/NirT family cytochrome c [Gammaproteobacteria bacterium]|nr:NapC/NirT family cytochrome c [Gammaproteobacteria bacterium]MCK5091355.1 NapC/NirT family cytochrome c [Gammaproteobacteria bacterium]